MPDMVDTMVSGHGIIPWHEKGIVVPGDIEWDEALHLGGIDWHVEQHQVLVQVPWHDPETGEVIGNRTLRDPNHVANVRSDNDAVLGITTPGFKPVQNDEALDFLKVLIEGGDCKLETVGSLKGGKLVFMCAMLDRDLLIGGESYVPYITGFNGHDGQLSFGDAVSPTRTVCKNTLQLAIRGAASIWRTRHTSGAKDRIAEAREALRLAWRYYDDFQHEVEALLAQHTTTDTVESMLPVIFPDQPKSVRGQHNAEANRDNVRMRWMSESEAIGRNAWAALNAFNGWELWDRGAVDAGSRAERQIRNVVGANPGKVTNEAHRLLVASR